VTPRDGGSPVGSAPASVRPTWVVRAVVAVLAHPALWGTAVRQLLVLAPTGWWRRAPYLPLPDPAYLRFRLQTAYGDPDREPDPSDLVIYLHWCRAWPRLTR
jgi:hypothetical protein